MAEHHCANFGAKLWCKIVGLGQELQGYPVLEVIAVVREDPDV
jgi:hypothetical protein